MGSRGRTCKGAGKVLSESQNVAHKNNLDFLVQAQQIFKEQRFGRYDRLPTMRHANFTLLITLIKNIELKNLFGTHEKRMALIQSYDGSYKGSAPSRIEGPRADEPNIAPFNVLIRPTLGFASFVVDLLTQCNAKMFLSLGDTGVVMQQPRDTDRSYAGLQGRSNKQSRHRGQLICATPPAPLRKTRWPWRWRKSWWPVGKTAACL